MKNYAKFQEVSLRAIEPEGWLRVYLENQARGLTGHMEAAGLPFDTPGWASHKLIDQGKRGWVPYEQTAYWTDGAVRLAHLLKDERLLKKALKGVEFTLRHPDADGYLGHPLMKPPKPYNRWPHAVFFRALMAHFGVTGDRRILEALRRHNSPAIPWRPAWPCRPAASPPCACDRPLSRSGPWVPCVPVPHRRRTRRWRSPLPPTGP